MIVKQILLALHYLQPGKEKTLKPWMNDSEPDFISI